MIRNRCLGNYKLFPQNVTHLNDKLLKVTRNILFDFKETVTMTLSIRFLEKFIKSIYFQWFINKKKRYLKACSPTYCSNRIVLWSNLNNETEECFVTLYVDLLNQNSSKDNLHYHWTVKNGLQVLFISYKNKFYSKFYFVGWLITIWVFQFNIENNKS